MNNFEHPGAVLASSHKINIENGCVQKNRQDKSLLDYYLDCLLYTSDAADEL